MRGCRGKSLGPYLIAWVVSQIEEAVIEVRVGSSINLDGTELLIMNIGESAPEKADEITAWSEATGTEIYTFPSLKE